MDRWKIEGNGIVWDVAGDAHLPHEDHIEMSGRKVSVIVRYRVDADRRLHLTREVIWPTLRTREGDVRAYLRRTFGDEATPHFTLNGSPLDPGPVEQISIGMGMLRIVHAPQDSLRMKRQLCPHNEEPLVSEEWSFVEDAFSRVKQGDGEANIRCMFDTPSVQTDGIGGAYVTEGYQLGPPYQLSVGDAQRSHVLHISTGFRFVFAARRDGVPQPVLAPTELSFGRAQRALRFERERLSVETPDPVLNTAFRFAELRAAESLFDTKMGLVHSPGGGRYYGGIWNNDQCEYSGPLFGYLGDDDARTAALTAYRNFAPYMTSAYKPIPSSLEMEGTIPWSGAGDRGDAAMYASGAARFALATGDHATAEELYPQIVWCLEYCRRKTNAEGVVTSDTDELEGRFPTGKANLSTSCLAYDGYRRGADVARALGKPEEAAAYDRRADELEGAIERYFGAPVEGLETYRYYDGNQTLRAWICLPLCFGITRRATDTVRALFSPRLWTADGLATEAGDKVFWDRSTLYALRGVFFTGETETALRYLTAYSRRRLLGDHVPYPVEAYPEGDQAHLSAESALYCRVFTEGLFGLVPTGLRSFRLTPHLPDAWPEMRLRHMEAFGNTFDLAVARVGDGMVSVRITSADHILSEQRGASGAAFDMALP
jgi:hypothetical protein